MIELLIITCVILTIIAGVCEANYLTAQSNYWNNVPTGDYEYYKDAGVIKRSLFIWLFPVAVLVCYFTLKLRNVNDEYGRK